MTCPSNVLTDLLTQKIKQFFLHAKEVENAVDSGATSFCGNKIS